MRILTDPYESGAFGGQLRFKPIRETVDAVVKSHDHADHGHVQGLPGKPKVLETAQVPVHVMPQRPALGTPNLAAEGLRVAWGQGARNREGPTGWQG